MPSDNMKWSVEVWYKPGVTDAVGDSVKKGVSDLGLPVPENVKTAQKYLIQGVFTRDEIEKICQRLLANPVIQDYKITEEK